MAGFLRILGSVRWPLLLLLLPVYGTLSRVEGSGGWAMLVAVSLLVLFWGLLNDTAQIERAKDPRLSLSWDRQAWSLDTLIGLRTVGGAAALLAALVLLFVAPVVGVWAVAAWAVLMVLCWLETQLDGQRRFWLVELVVPLAATVLPALIVAHAYRRKASLALEHAEGAIAETLPTLHAHPTVAMLALLTAFVLGSILLLCLIRDEVPDAAAGYRTTPTAIGRTGSVVLVAFWQLAAIMIAAIGIQAGVWSWAVPSLLACGAVATAWLLASRADGLAVVLWWLAGTAGAWAALVG